MKKLLATFFMLHLSFFAATAQGERSEIFELDGYLKEMPSMYILQKEVPVSATENMKRTWYNLVHNRMNFKINVATNLKLNIGMRNRFLAGGLIHTIPQYADVLSVDQGLVDLSWNIFNKRGAVFNTSFDRVCMDLTLKTVQIKIGRQRVNWGIGLVWNPNDIFNAFSYIDFDYEERPGSDAVSISWYRSATSTLDVVGKISRNPADSARLSTLAARYLFNLKNYDLQFIAGKFNDDFISGFGWSGAIKNVSFRGEMSVFTPVMNRNIHHKTTVVATIEFDYTFGNQLYLHSAALFNSSGKTQNPEGMNLLATQNDLSAKKLSYGKYELFGQAAYPVSPVSRIGLAAMLNPVDLSTYLTPNCVFSLADNLELMLNAQLLLGKSNTEYAVNGNIYAAFARLKWNF
jgi:hypothetical protein